MKKRILMLMLATAMILPLAACGGSKGGDTQQETTDDGGSADPYTDPKKYLFRNMARIICEESLLAKTYLRAICRIDCSKYHEKASRVAAVKSRSDEALNKCFERTGIITQ